MPRSPNQKLKLLYLARYLWKTSDETHPLSVADMIACLERNGISAERKSIYSDIEALRTFGMDIVRSRTAQGTGYFVGSREFELAELRILIDSAHASRFITESKSRRLITKLASLASAAEARELTAQAYARNPVKAPNETIYYNVSDIHSAISQNRQIGFKYLEYTLSGGLAFKKGGGEYIISPFALLCDDDNYYVVGYDSPAGKIKHFRVDKMSSVRLLEDRWEGLEKFKSLDLGAYSRKMFSMFDGEKRSVTFEFDNSLIGVAYDRFGKDIMPVPRGGRFRFTAEVAVSPQFFGWLFGLGELVRIISPDDVREKMSRRLKAVSELYEG